MIAVIGVLSMIGCLVFLVLGFIALIRNRSKAKKRFIISGSLFALMIVLVIIDPSTSSNVETTTAASANKVSADKVEVASEPAEAVKVDAAKQKEDAAIAAKAAQDAAKKKAAEEKAAADKAKAEKIKQQKIVKAFEKDFIALEDQGDNVFKNYQNVITGLSNGTSDVYTAYSATTDAKNMAKSLASQYYSMKVPDGLPDDASKPLKEAAMQAFYAYSTKADAYDNVLEFLDEQKPSLLQEFKENIAMSDQQLIKVALNILKAKEQVGLK